MQPELEIRDYLLGRLPVERLQVVEEKILTDDEFHQEVEISEEELLDDYVRGALTPEERRLFETNFLAISLRRQKLKFAEALGKKLRLAAQVPPHSTLRRSTSPYRYALAASLALAAVLGVMNYRASEAAQQERSHVASLKKQLEEARQEAANLLPNSVLQAELSPRGSRGGPQPELIVSEKVSAVRFVLAVPPNIQGAVNAELLNDAGQTILSQHGNLITQAKDHSFVTVMVESTYLKPGNYFLRVTPLGERALPEYVFKVPRQHIQ
jgi:hypothetical protein